jgi:hypothetical protein
MTNKEIYLAATTINPISPTEFWKSQKASGLSPIDYLSELRYSLYIGLTCVLWDSFLEGLISLPDALDKLTEEMKDRGLARNLLIEHCPIGTGTHSHIINLVTDIRKSGTRNLRKSLDMAREIKNLYSL